MQQFYLLRRILSIIVFTIVNIVVTSTAEAQNIPVLDVSPDNAEPVDFDTYVNEINYLVLDLPEFEFLREVLKVVMNDSGIYVLDVGSSGERPKIYKFDHSGEFAFVLDKPGRGPGEFELIYDFSVVDDFLAISTNSEIKFYSAEDGEYSHSFDKPRTDFIQTFKMIDESTLVYNSGRTRNNTDKKLVKVYDVENSRKVFEALSFGEHALKGGHSYRYIFDYQDEISIVPDYSQTVFRLHRNGDNFEVIPAYKFDFGDHWIDDGLLDNSYTKRDNFFSKVSDYVHTIEVFETTDVIYANYRLKGENFTYLYDRQSGQSVNISEFNESPKGWLNTPETVYQNAIVNLVRDFEIGEMSTEWEEELSSILADKEENAPLLILAELNFER